MTTSVKTGDATVTANSEANIELTDDYNKLAGNLKIMKTIDGDNVTEDDLKNLTFTVTGPDKFDDVILKLADFEQQEDGTYVYEFKDIPLGEYTVEEVQSNIPGYSVTTTFIVDDKDSADGKAEVKDDQTTIVDITDTYTKLTEFGNLKVTKTLAGDKVTEDDLKNLTFTIEGPEGFSTVNVKLGDFTKQNDGTYVYELKEIPLGEYTVAETQANITGYDVKTSINVENGKVEVKNGETAAVEITNEYIRKNGKLTFTKSVTGGVTAEEA